ncbi:MAG: CopD family protein [Bacteroidia bacterium]
MYFYLKALHIIFIVTWFAALFYMPRLFVYDIEARAKEATTRDILLEQFRIMQKRLWFGIAWPSMIITLILGPWLAIELGYHPAEQAWNWLNWKIALVVLLTIYHVACHKIMLMLANNKVPMSSQGMRMWNEVATVFLFGIVFLVVFRNTVSLLYGITGLFALIATLMIAIKLYKLLRR